MTRKSPIKHHVRKHIRKERPVHDYDRGKGERSNPAKPTLHKKSKKAMNRYHATIIYDRHKKESFTVTAKSYPEAVELAMISRVRITPPKEIEVTRILGK